MDADAEIASLKERVGVLTSEISELRATSQAQLASERAEWQVKMGAAVAAVAAATPAALVTGSASDAGSAAELEALKAELETVKQEASLSRASVTALQDQVVVVRQQSEAWAQSEIARVKAELSTGVAKGDPMPPTSAGASLPAVTAAVPAAPNDPYSMDSFFAKATPAAPPAAAAAAAAAATATTAAATPSGDGKLPGGTSDFDDFFCDMGFSAKASGAAEDQAGSSTEKKAKKSSKVKDSDKDPEDEEGKDKEDEDEDEDSESGDGDEGQQEEDEEEEDSYGEDSDSDGAKKKKTKKEKKKSKRKEKKEKKKSKKKEKKEKSSPDKGDFGGDSAFAARMKTGIGGGVLGTEVCQYHHLETQTFMRPTYCMVCSELLAGLYKQGLTCTHCNLFSCHDQCKHALVTAKEVSCRIGGQAKLVPGRVCADGSFMPSGVTDKSGSFQQ